MLDLLEHDILFSINIKMQTNDVVFLLKTTDNDEFPGDKQFLSFIVWSALFEKKADIMKSVRLSVQPSVTVRRCWYHKLLTV